MKDRSELKNIVAKMTVEAAKEEEFVKRNYAF